MGGVTLVGKTVTSLVTTRLRVLIWDVYETARGCHLADLSVKIREAPTVPSSLPIVLTPPARSIAGRGSRDAAEAFVAGTYLVGGTERRGTKRLFDLLGA